MADENIKEIEEMKLEQLPEPVQDEDTAGESTTQEQPEEESSEQTPEQPPQALLQVDTLQDSDVHTDSCREEDATTTEAEVDTEIEVDPDDINDVKPSTSGSGIGSIVSNHREAAADDDEHVNEKQPLTDVTTMPQSDPEIDLEKGHASTNGGRITPKDMIVVTTEGQTQKEFMKFLRKREIVFCMIGGIAFLIGLIMIIIGLLVMQGKCDKRYWTPEHSTNHKMDSTALVRSGHDHNDHLDGDSDHHDRQVVYVHNHHINNDIDVTFEGVTSRNQTQDSKLNLAEGRPAYQSTTEVHEGVSHNASLATDGLTSLTKATCSKTELEEKPYWFVDLGKEQRVQRIKLIAQAGQLHDFEVRIGSNMEDLRLNHLCKEFLGTALKVSINLKCDQYYIGRYVSIQMLGDESRPRDTLSLCEVLVYAI